MVASMFKSLLAISPFALTFLVLECFGKSSCGLEVTHVAFACEKFLILPLPQLLYDSELKYAGSLPCKKANVGNKQELFFSWWGTGMKHRVLRVMISSRAQMWLMQQGPPYRKAAPCREALLPTWEEGSYLRILLKEASVRTWPHLSCFA